MAQYTAALAEEYNAMQREVAKILGPANSSAKSYGAYNVDGFRQSSPVTVGQLIKPAEWENLRTDLNTIIWYTKGSRTFITNPVQYNTIAWSDVVAYQNVYNGAYDDAINHRYYNGGTFGSINLDTTAVDGTHIPGDWGGTAGTTTADGIYFASYAQFSDFNELNAFFNLGGYLYINLSASGGEVTTTGKKDYAIAHVCSASSATYGFNQWWNNGGSTISAGTYLVQSSTINDATYSPYTVAGKSIRAYTTFYYDGARTIYLNGYVQDFAIGTTSDGVTDEPRPTCSVKATVSAHYPGGGNEGAGVEAGYVITKTAPLLGTVSWGVYNA